MDRSQNSPPATPAHADPPHDPAFVRATALTAVGLGAAAAGLGVVAAMTTPPPAVLGPVQLLLSVAGAITAGAAVSMRPDLWWSWGLAAVAALLGSVGLPASWDSFPPLFRALAGVCAVGALVCASSTGWRVAIASGCILFHFTGIFAATTSPPPQPWIVEQAWTRAYHPYLNFIYLRNAYHFYSPDPGPASLLVFHLRTEIGTDPLTGKKQYRTQWVATPKRPQDIRDPLGLSFYRRLSLTEHTARGGAALLVPSDQFEKTEVMLNRQAVAGQIPFHPVDDVHSVQYRIPYPEIIRFVLPSYASHVLLEHTPDAETAARTTVKIYRLEHLTTSPDRFRTGDNPYHPATYRPYYQGEFGFVPDPANPGQSKVELLDTQDKLLYWMIPVIPRYPGPGDPNPKAYIDYMSVHALDMKPEDVVAADEKDGRVFDWSQLR